MPEGHTEIRRSPKQYFDQSQGVVALRSGLAPVSWTGESLGSDYLIWRHVGLLLRDILWFGSGRRHSSVPACTMVRPSRTAAVKDGPLYLAIAGHEAVGEPIGGWEPAAPQGQ